MLSEIPQLSRPTHLFWSWYLSSWFNVTMMNIKEKILSFLVGSFWDDGVWGIIRIKEPQSVSKHLRYQCWKLDKCKLLSLTKTMKCIHFYNHSDNVVYTGYIICIILSFTGAVLKCMQINSDRNECLSGEEQLRCCPGASVTQIFVTTRECAFTTRQYDNSAWWLDIATVSYTRSCLHFIYQCSWFDLVMINATCVVIAWACNYC